MRQAHLFFRCISSPGMLGNIIALFAGALFAFGFAPYQFWPAAIFSVFLYILGHHNLTPRQAAFRGFFFGLGQFGHGVSWLYVSLHDYADQPMLLAACMTFICISVFACFPLFQSYFYVKARLYRKPLLGLPSLWVLFEWFRLKLFTGFPWLFMGYIFTNTIIGRSLAPISGVFGLSFFGVLFSVLLAQCCMLWLEAAEYKILWRPTLFITGIFLGIFLLAKISWVTVNHHRVPLHVALIQGNVPQDVKWLESNILPTQEKYQTLTEGLLAGNEKFDLIVWPEAAITSFYQEAWEYIDRIDVMMLTHNTAWVFGISTFNAKKDYLEFHNSILALGQGQGIYHKQKLVPFGEYVPFAEWFGRWLPFLNIPMSGFTPGLQTQISPMVHGAKLASFVCYEILYPDFVRHYAQTADFLLTISNDAWFGHSLAAYQHFEMARMRAMEQGKYLVRGTNTGITGIVDYQGRILKQAPLFRVFSLKGNVYFMQGHTPFSRWGSAPLLILCGLLILFLIRGNKRCKIFQR